jgi:hypothetical protein
MDISDEFRETDMGVEERVDPARTEIASAIRNQLEVDPCWSSSIQVESLQKFIDSS